MATRKLRRPLRFTVLIERDEDGRFVASIPSLKGCHTQGKSLDQVMRRIREAAELWLEVRGSRRRPLPGLDFVGIQQLDIPA